MADKPEARDPKKCLDQWHITLSIRHEICPTCGGTWKREADDSMSRLFGAIADVDDVD
jgi:hypothetical protein